jgi:hypothetical protein
MFDSIASDTAGQFALSRFFTSITWNAQQIFKASAIDVPGAIFQSSGTISANPVGYGGSNVTAQFIAAESSAFPYTLYEATGNANGHVLAFRQSRGTYASRTGTQSADILGQLDWGGHNATTLVNGRVKMVAIANQVWTAANNGTSLEFYVTPSNTAASTLGLRLSAGTLLSGHNAEFFGTIFLKNATGINFESVLGVSESVLSVTTANNVQLISPTASGNILISNRATGGSIQLNAGTSTGIITLATGGATRLTIASGGVSTFSGAVITQAEFQVQGAAGTTRGIFLRTVGSTRWLIQADSVAEGTSNAGSNFSITRYSDAQVNLGVALGINRATGVTTLGADRLILTTAYTPPNSSDPGVAGQITWDSNYIYVWNAASGANCVKRIALTTF